jgi:hypothetical protein
MTEAERRRVRRQGTQQARDREVRARQEWQQGEWRPGRGER